MAPLAASGCPKWDPLFSPKTGTTHAKKKGAHGKFDHLSSGRCLVEIPRFLFPRITSGKGSTLPIIFLTSVFLLFLCPKGH